MKRQALFLVALLTSTALVGCGGSNKKSSSIPPAPSSSSSLPESSSSLPESSSSLPESSSPLPESSSSLPESSSSLPESSSSLPESSSSEAPSSSSEEPSSSSIPESSSVNPATPIVLPDPDITDEKDYTQKSYPDEILLNNRLVSVVVGETFKLEGLEQFNYSGKNLNFASSDTSIATVAADGTVTGVAGGETTVVVSDKDNPDLKRDVRVIVSPTITESAASTLNEGFTAAYGEENITKLKQYQNYIKTVYKNDVLYRFDRMDRRSVIDKENAFFSVTDDDAEVITSEGAMTFESSGWIFHTNEFFDTNLFHKSNGVKTYLTLATQSYMGGDRIAPLLDIMDNVFTSGKSFFNGPLENASLKDVTERVGNVSDAIYGSNGDKNMVFSYSGSGSQKSDAEDEDYYGIPYGTTQNFDQSLRYTIVNNRMVSYMIDIDETYVIGADNFREVYHIEFTFDDVDEIAYPNKKDYTRVDDIFDL